MAALAAGLADPEHHALSPADACPDNNLLLADGCRLIDFEWAEVRHPAWDAAYLAVPWPTCWCSWRIPDATAARALDAYRGAAAEGSRTSPRTPSRPTSRRPRVLGADLGVLVADDRAPRGADAAPGQPGHPAADAAPPGAWSPRPGRSAADFAGAVLEHTREQWGDLALELAPAYR